MLLDVLLGVLLDVLLGVLFPAFRKNVLISFSRAKLSIQNNDFYNTLQCPVVIKRYII